MPPLSQWRQRRIERLEELASAVGELFKGPVEVSGPSRCDEDGRSVYPDDLLERVELCHEAVEAVPRLAERPRRVGETTSRQADLMRAAIARARDLLDESEDSPQAVALADAFDDLDAYCESCDDEGFVEQVRNAFSSTCDPAVVDVVPCDCEAARVIAAQRADRRAAERAADEVPC